MEHVTLDFRVLRASHWAQRSLSGKQEFLDIFQDTENTIDKMLEANPNLEVWQCGQGIKIMFTPNYELYDKEKESGQL